jgi:hypothetical protein
MSKKKFLEKLLGALFSLSDYGHANVRNLGFYLINLMFIRE